jgi:hypothetical protein
MERLTNKYSDLHAELKIELLTLDTKEEEKCVIQYLELPWIPGGQFSLFIIKDTSNGKSRAVKKSWNNEYDLERFSSGVFNLDRLCIKTDNFQFTPVQQKQFDALVDSIINVPATLEETDYIVLDGVDYELTIKSDRFDKHYRWKLPTGDIQQFKPLIDFLLTTFNK